MDHMNKDHMDKDGRPDDGTRGAWFDRNGFRPAPYTPGRMVTAVAVPWRVEGVRHLVRAAAHVERRVNGLAEGTPMRFDVRFFRRPRPIGECDGTEEDAGNGWNCRWIEWTVMATATKSKTRYTTIPKRLQFNLPLLYGRINRGSMVPMLRVSFRAAFPGMDDSPMVTHIERMLDLLDLEDAGRDRLLTEDPDRAQPHMLALVERSTGVVIPVAAGSRIEMTAERDHPDGMLIRVNSHYAMTEPPERGDDGWRRYDWPHGDYADADLRADIDRWGARLGRLIAMRDRPEYDTLRNDIKETQERIKHDDQLNA